ncbi:uncharacterized protein TRIADDRAFT_59127 [Trichoplax adhaerens]|uniref:CCHC-type domain-containing protein n=1 Tax=Trichoplax adhaerens TaxID=10228 RepID=B3S4L3_TRIAD|nr:predicted protein [Trichoplax adhaerens]EDV22489.1 predicted protein [Trichoplax adhaerens]|eukprot:XP_002115033.1 predicted protein [Trichoplax adhaerens]
MALHKQKAYMYAKEFNLRSIRDNLQAYNLVTRQFDQRDIESNVNIHRLDKGKVYGSLITMQRHPLMDTKESTPTVKRKQRRRKRRKKNSGTKTVTNSDNTGMKPVGSTESHVKNHKEHLKLPDIFRSGTTAIEMESENFAKVTPNDDTEIRSSYFGLVSYSSSSNEASDACESCNNFSNDRIASVCRPKSEIRTSGKTETSSETEEYDFTNNNWRKSHSNLSSFKCWKCKRIGHLANDCTVTPNIDRSLPLASNNNSYQRGINTFNKRHASSKLIHLYRKCRKIRKLKDPSCIRCGTDTNVALCLDCDTMFCDGNGHLVDHLLEHPDHNKLFSFKLRRLIKCCKPTCDIIDIYKLRKCSICLDKFSSRHYSMINALWSQTGIRNMPNAVCCEDHFEWHRMNCGTISEEMFADQKLLEKKKSSGNGFVSEFFF